MRSYIAASSRGDVLALEVLDDRDLERGVVVDVLDQRGIACCSAIFEARQRRSPAMSWNRPPSMGRSRMAGAPRARGWTRELDEGRLVERERAAAPGWARCDRRAPS
jgi:hypothetical protein